MAIKYCDENIVREKLKNKVRVTDDPNGQPDRMSITLFRRLIEEAEAQVETDLSPRYLPPFQTIEGEAFTLLPDTTKSTLRMICELKAVVHILGTDFGTGAAANGNDYRKTLSDRYDEQKDKLLEKRSGSFMGWSLPPLQGLSLNFHNRAADDGFAGRILSTSDGDGGYPKHQINEPSLTFFSDRGHDDDCER